MAHFAGLEKNKLGELVVKDCIVVSNKIIENKKAWWDPAGLFTERGENEAVGIAFCQNHWESSPGGFPGVYGNSILIILNLEATLLLMEWFI